MNPDIHLDPPASHPQEAAKNISWLAGDAAKEAAERAGVAAHELTDAAKRAGETAKEFYHTAAAKAGETLETSKEYVRRNPLPVLLGAIAAGAALGYMLMAARRKPTFGERYAGEPMIAGRDAILGALAPVTQRVHSGYDSALDGAEKAMDRMHHFSSGNSFSRRIGRIGNNLKFW